MLGLYLSDKNATFQEGGARDKLALPPRGEQGGGHGTSPSPGAVGRQCRHKEGLRRALGLALQPGHCLLQVLHDEVHLSPGAAAAHAQPDGVPGHVEGDAAAQQHRGRPAGGRRSASLPAGGPPALQPQTPPWRQPRPPPWERPPSPRRLTGSGLSGAAWPPRRLGAGLLHRGRLRPLVRAVWSLTAPAPGLPPLRAPACQDLIPALS